MSDDEGQETRGNGLRAQLEEALASIKALQDENAKFRAADRSRSIEQTLAAKGANPKIAKFIGEDVKDIDAWLTEHADVFGLVSEGEASGGQQAPAQPASSVDPQVAAAAKQFQYLQQGARPGGSIEDITNRIRDAKTPDEVDRLMAEATKLMLT